MDQTQPKPSSSIPPTTIAAESDSQDHRDVSEKEAEKISPSSSPGDIVYPPTREALPIMLALGLAIFLFTLDRSIIATATPRITDEFHSLGDVGWYGSAYMLTASALMLLLGKIYTFYSPKFVLLISIGLFEVGSAICGAAPSSVVFIIGRAISGWGASGIFTGAVVVVQYILPLQKRPMVMGLFGGMTGISSVAGPLLGGAFTDKLSWRWCFYINLPIGGLAMAILLFVLKAPSPVKGGTSLREQFIQLDPLGTLCLLPGVTCLLLALQWGGSKYPWSNARVIVLLVISSLLIIGFIVIQILMPDTATVPPRIFKQRSISAGFCYCICNGAAMFIVTYYLPQWFQAVKGVDAVQSGLDTLPLLIALTLASICAGIFVSKVGYYVPLMIGGPIFMSIGAGLVTTFHPDTTTAKWIGYQILFGIGVGGAMQQASVAAQTVLLRKDIAIGSALMMFGQQMSGSIFVSIAQTAFVNRLVSGLENISGLDPYSIVNTGATEITSTVPAKYLDVVLSAYNNALVGSFTVVLAMTCLAIVPAVFMEWKSVKDKKNPGAASEA